MHREARISNYLLAGFALVSLVLLSLPLSAPVLAFKACVAYVLNPVAFYGAKGAERLSGIPGRVRGLLVADIENRLLREEIRRAAWVQAEADALRAENQRLRPALGLKPPEGLEPLWARVMERDPLHWYRSLMVDAGSEEGVALNTPVLGQKEGRLVAIGRVVEVRPRSSLVLLVTDELSSVAATLSASALEGLVQGQGGRRLLMNYLSSEVQLQAGESVTTSPTSATFPPEILIGTAVRVRPRDPFLTYQAVEVEPAVEGSALTEVLLLKKALPGRSQSMARSQGGGVSQDAAEAAR